MKKRPRDEEGEEEVNEVDASAINVSSLSAAQLDRVAEAAANKVIDTMISLMKEYHKQLVEDVAAKVTHNLLESAPDYTNHYDGCEQVQPDERDIGARNANTVIHDQVDNVASVVVDAIPKRDNEEKEDAQHQVAQPQKTITENVQTEMATPTITQLGDAVVQTVATREDEVVETAQMDPVVGDEPMTSKEKVEKEAEEQREEAATTRTATASVEQV